METIVGFVAGWAAPSVTSPTRWHSTLRKTRPP